MCHVIGGRSRHVCVWALTLGLQDTYTISPSTTGFQIGTCCMVLHNIAYESLVLRWAAAVGFQNSTLWAHWYEGVGVSV